ncbi:alginate lyase family protein [Labrys wisconsinensis]|uniref:Poly(Beta-D-mannuronate) lyase n=1 Tax=Labrys wisconsinensis TaxID=425677 RepID=A0ABU0JD83_9HYPH|nr:alginate lyase family protein [Labrys wisconsinensis]MDQ0472238.1 poly(beta-D-mannuronate) lyase [Labrys wisconsinensis]
MLRLFACMLLAGLVAGTACRAAEIRLPFAPRPPSDASAPETCSAPPPPVTVLAVVSKYGDDGPRRDTVDPAADARFEAEIAPVRAYVRSVVEMANGYRRSGDPGTARCALAWLAAWAGADALSQAENPNSQFQRAEALSGLGLALLQIAPAVRVDPRYAAAAAWMARLAAATDGFFDATREKLKGSRNNHAYWAALASAAAAAAVGDQALLDWSVEVYRTAVCGATPAGALPLELGRGKKALAYHLFALSALVPVAAFAQANGIDAFGFCDGALHRIVRFSLDALADPHAVAVLADAPQDGYAGGLPTGGEVAFLEIYHRAFPGRAPLEARLLALRPLKSTALGGDQTLLYGGR